MTLEGKQLIGQQAVTSDGKPIHAVDPATGETLSPAYPAGGQIEVERACDLAWAAFDAYRETGLEARAAFLETVADEIEAIGDDLITRAMAESGLPR
ncbi:aldehyde dehydrogenase family protein, partial [Halomonas organivorans]